MALSLVSSPKLFPNQFAPATALGQCEGCTGCPSITLDRSASQSLSSPSLHYSISFEQGIVAWPIAKFLEIVLAPQGWNHIRAHWRVNYKVSELLKVYSHIMISRAEKAHRYALLHWASW